MRHSPDHTMPHAGHESANRRPGCESTGTAANECRDASRKRKGHWDTSIPFTWGDAVVPSYLYRVDEKHFGFMRFVEARVCKAPKEILLCPRPSDCKLMERCHEEFLQRVRSNMLLFVQEPGASSIPRMFRLELHKVQCRSGSPSGKWEHIFREEFSKQTVKIEWEKFQSCELMKHVLEGGCPSLKQPYGPHEDPLACLSPLCSSSGQAEEGMTALDVFRSELRAWVCLPAYATVTSHGYGDACSEGHGWGHHQGGSMRFEGFCNVHDCFLSLPLLVHEERKEGVAGKAGVRQDPIFAPSFFQGQSRLDRTIWDAVTKDAIQLHQGGKLRLLASMVNVIKYHDLHSATVVRMLDGRIFQFAKNPGKGNSTEHVSRSDYRDVRLPKQHYMEQESLTREGQCKDSEKYTLHDAKGRVVENLSEYKGILHDKFGHPCNVDGIIPEE